MSSASSFRFFGNKQTCEQKTMSTAAWKWYFHNESCAVCELPGTGRPTNAKKNKDKLKLVTEKKKVELTQLQRMKVT